MISFFAISLDGMFYAKYFLHPQLSEKAGEILNYVKSEGIDLIIMGHSRKGIRRLILGSVAQHVLKWSTVPVMIVSPHEVQTNK